MIRISLPYLINLMEALEPLSRIQPAEGRMTAWLAIWTAQSQLQQLQTASIYSAALRSSRALGDELLAALANFDVGDLNKAVGQFELFPIIQAYSRYKIALLAELGVIPSYFVTQKGGYDTLSLLDRDDAIFPMELAIKVPEAVIDAQQAGKALAFDLATSCGFHVFRVTEAVIKRYWDHGSGGKSRPKLETIGSYAAEMEKQKIGDDKIVKSLKQMARLHRNPLIHPDVILTGEEAIGLLGIARSIVAAMLTALPDLPPTTGASTGP